ncbi:tegument protein [Cricetid gammaherpesvirus 2]|uniref:Tegument protein n=1 Tax=Cricetid gammaherpesvirus 2 TaxID=1605972 RepID=E9M5P7_9GAMA|nr:tegument protein [Cricetid gammaherpesvirus 2]ADW24405.1 tegument protein [Cricetid gammaherpesvirus 2]ADW24487.1 tegument protein [Cricetid gammaherpesvirus 2]
MALPAKIKNLHIEGTASTNQGHPKFGCNAGAQCLSNSVVYLMSSFFNQETPVTDTDSLDTVLRYGARLDTEIRNTGLLAPGQYAQFDVIPSYIQTKKWAGFLYKSSEVFGLLATPSAIQDTCIATMLSILSNNYSNTTQYLLYICQSKSGAIIIKPDKFYIFDPHCLCGLPESPAHVSSASDAKSILQYIGHSDYEYTACFLYFVPGHIMPEKYIMDHYKVISFEPSSGSKIILEDYAHLALSATPPHLHDGQSTPTRGTSLRKAKNMTILLNHLAVAGSKRPRCQTSMAMFGESPSPTSKKRFITPPATSSLSSDQSDITIYSDPDTPKSDSSRGTTIDTQDEYVEIIEENDDMSPQSPHPQQQQYTPTFDTTTIETLINSLTVPNHTSTNPSIYCDKTKSNYNIAIILSRLNCLIQHLIETGMSTTSQPDPNPGITQLLNFFILCLEKLSMPTKDAHIIMATNLEVPKILNVIKHDLIDDKNISDHLQAKLSTCLPNIYKIMYQNMTTLIKQCMSIKATIETKKQIKDVSQVAAILSKELPSDFYMVCTKEDLTNIQKHINDVKLAMQQQHVNTMENTSALKALLSAITNMDPPPPSIIEGILDIPEAAKEIEESLITVCENLKTSIIGTLQSFSQDHAGTITASTEPPNVAPYITHIQNLIETISNIQTKLGIQGPSIHSAQQTLLQLGYELSEILNSPWDLGKGASQMDMPIFNKVKDILKQKHKLKSQEATANGILADIEGILASFTAAPDSTGPSILSTLDTYIKNAGAIITPSTTERFKNIQEAVSNVTTSTQFIHSLLSQLSQATVVTVVPQLLQISKTVQGNNALKTLSTDLALAANTLISETISSLHVKSHSLLTSGYFSNLLSLLSIAEFEGKDDLVKSMESILSLQLEDLSNEDLPTIEKAMGSYAYIKSLLKKSKLDKLIKSKLLLIISSELKDLQKIKETIEFEEWKTKVALFTPQNLNELADFVDSAPTKKIKAYAARQLKQIKDSLLSEQAMDTSSPPIIQPQETKSESGAKAFKKVKTAFRDLVFSEISQNDWLSIMEQTRNPNSELYHTAGKELLSLLQNLQAYISEVVSKKLAAMLPFGTPYSLPNLSWVPDYESNVHFVLLSSTFPKISQEISLIDKKLILLKQLSQAVDLTQGTAGTYIEPQWLLYDSIYKELESTSTDHIISTKSKVSDFISFITLDDRPILTKSDIPSVTKTTKLLSDEQLGQIRQLESPFSDSLIANEKRFIGIHETEFTILQDWLNSVIKTKQQSIEEYNTKLLKAVQSLLHHAPPFISSTPPTPPVIQYLQSLTRNKHIMETLPYATALQCTKWLYGTTSTMLTLCHSSDKEELTNLLSEIQQKINTFTSAVNLEAAATNGADTSSLETAIKTLDGSRLTHGKDTLSSWKTKLSEIRKTIEITSKVASLSQLIKSTHLKTLTELLPSELQSHLETIRKTAIELKSINASSQTMAERILNFVTYKHEFLAAYESSQSAIFSNFPLTRYLPIRGPQGVTYTITFQPLKRLQHLQTRPKAPRNSQWIEVTTAPIDPVGTTLVPVMPATQSSPPIHYKVLFSCFLDAEAPQLLTRDVFSSPPHNALSIVRLGRVGLDATILFTQQWSDISNSIRNLLQMYTATDIHPATIKQKEFTSMSILSHLTALSIPHATKYHHSGTSLPNIDGITIHLNHMQYTQLLITMWPNFIKSLLHSSSFSDALFITQTLSPWLLQKIPKFTLAAFLNNLQHRQHVLPDAHGIICFVDELSTTDLSKTLWKASPFYEFTKNEQRSRIHLLLWAVLTIDHIILSQLWQSLKPQTGIGIYNYIDFIAHLINCTTDPGPIEVFHYSTTDHLPPSYEYGDPTKNGYKVLGQERTIKQAPQLTSFEAVVGCLILKIKFQLFSTPVTPFAKTKRGNLHLLSHMLDGSGMNDPYSSFLLSPRTPYTTTNLLKSMCCEDELQIFERQVDWLESSLYSLPETTNTHILISSPDNQLTSCLMAPASTSGIIQEAVEFTVSPVSDQWPMDIITSLEWTSEARHASNLFIETTAKHQASCGTDVFASFPPFKQNWPEDSASPRPESSEQTSSIKPHKGTPPPDPLTIESPNHHHKLPTPPYTDHESHKTLPSPPSPQDPTTLKLQTYPDQLARSQIYPSIPEGKPETYIPPWTKNTKPPPITTLDKDLTPTVNLTIPPKTPTNISHRPLNIPINGRHEATSTTTLPEERSPKLFNQASTIKFNIPPPNNTHGERKTKTAKKLYPRILTPEHETSPVYLHTFQPTQPPSKPPSITPYALGEETPVKIKKRPSKGQVSPPQSVSIVPASPHQATTLHSSTKDVSPKQLEDDSSVPRIFLSKSPLDPAPRSPPPGLRIQPQISDPDTHGVFIPHKRPSKGPLPITVPPASQRAPPPPPPPTTIAQQPPPKNLWTVPSITHKYPTIKSIVEDPTLLARDVPISSTHPPALGRPAPELVHQAEIITASKNSVLDFIAYLLNKIKDNSVRLVQTIARLKALYL